MAEVHGRLKALSDRVASRLVRGAGGLTLLFRKVDQRRAVGMAFVLIALAIVSGPASTVSGWLATHGLSPRGYAYGIAVAGTLILTVPRTRWYPFLALGSFPYWFALIGYTFETGINLVDLLVYTLCGFFVLRAE